MSSANWQPKWWTAEKHGSAWDKVKDAMKRDWEQTKADLHLGGQDLNQELGDTVRQAQGKEAIPPTHVANPGGANSGSDIGWSDAEEGVRYGYGARDEYGTQHAAWDDNLETRLKSDWEGAGNGVIRKWDEVKHAVRRGYERAHT